MEKQDKIKEFIYIARHYFKQETNKVYSPTQIGQHLTNIKKGSRLPNRTKTAEMIEILESSDKLKKIELSFPSKKYTRYTWGEKSIYEILLSLDVNAYYSHFSALYFHKLLDRDETDIYLNIEQSPKREYINTMMQENINKAFSRIPRITNNVTNYMQNKIYLLNGKNTGKLGVISMKGPHKEKIFLTNIERTLIDIAIRPQYSGGVSNVLNVYRKVIQNISAEKILKMLTKLKYLYPYHQTIGFYLDKAGLKKDSIIFREKIRIKYDFYLTYQIDNPEYCEKWRIYYPKSLFVTPAK